LGEQRQRDAAARPSGRGASQPLRSVTTDGHHCALTDPALPHLRYRTPRVAPSPGGDPTRGDPVACPSLRHLYTQAGATGSLSVGDYREEGTEADWHSCRPGVDGGATRERRGRLP